RAPQVRGHGRPGAAVAPVAAGARAGRGRRGVMFPGEISSGHAAELARIMRAERIEAERIEAEQEAARYGMAAAAPAMREQYEIQRAAADAAHAKAEREEAQRREERAAAAEDRRIALLASGYQPRTVQQTLQLMSASFDALTMVPPPSEVSRSASG